jgi:hypothetical protein
MLTEKDFYDYFAEETISIGFVSTHKPEEPNLFRGLGFLSITEGQRWLAERWEKLIVLST